MDELERQLVELDLDIEKAKRYRRGLKEQRKSKSAAGGDTSELEKTLKKTKQELAIGKSTRQEIVDRLLEGEAAEGEVAISAK